MFSSSLHDRTILKISKAAFLGITIESFLIDRKAAGLSPYTIKFYRQFITPLLTYCDANAAGVCYQAGKKVHVLERGEQETPYPFSPL